MSKTSPLTYRVVATFQARDGHRSRKTIGRGLPLQAAIEKKTALVCGVPHCLGADCYPEGGAR